MSQSDAAFQGFPPTLATGAGNPEAAKYGRMWERPEYREVSPGEGLARVFLDQARPKPGSEVLDLGCGTGRGGLMLALLGQCKITYVDFVGNCLDEDVRAALTTQGDTLRFVKADLEQPLPVGAEYGFCCDVMEHIPPEKVDRVLDNILLSAQHVFFSIATTEDVCGKLIDEPLHLSVHPFQWWQEQFTKRECLIHWSEERADGSACFYVTAWQASEAIMAAGQLDISTEQIQANVRANAAGPWTQATSWPPNDLEVAILGGGPSVAQFEAQIRAQQAAGVKLVTLNGAYGWAHARGLWPVTQIMCDARPFNARFVEPVDRRCQYLICSQCDPAVFAPLPLDRTWIWHSGGVEVHDILAQAYAKWNIIPGGSTVLLRAVPLLRTLGYTKFHLYGCDSCLDETAAHHAYAQPENEGARVFKVIVTGGRIFHATGWMISQAQELTDLIRHLGDEVELEIYGDGLLAHMLRTAATIEDTEEG